MLNRISHKIFGKALAIILLLSASLQSVAQDGKFTASVSNSTVSVGEQIQVTFSFEGNGSRFQAPSFVDFNLLMGPSTSTSMSIFNGSMTQTSSYTYVIQATKEGTFKIPGATIESGGKKITSNGLTITVVKGAKPQAGGNQQNQQGGSNDNSASGGKNVFIKVSLDKSNVYQGEGIIVTYKLYTKVNLVNYSLSKMPSLNGFFSQDIQMPQQLEFKRENMDGVAYNVADIKKMVLFPQRSGTLVLDAMEGEVVAQMQVKRQQQNNDPFSQFFNDPFANNPFFNNSVQNVKVPLKSEPVRITVRDLPSNAPSAFKGAVGKFTMEATLDKKETKSHEPVTLKIKVSGKGNLKLIDPPSISFPAEFETYDPKVSQNITATAAGVNGNKTFEYLVIPRNAGEFKIPVSGFCYFDLDKKDYVNIPAEEFILKVDKGDETVTTVISGVNKSDIQFLGKDIHFIKTNKPAFIKANEIFFNSGLFYSMMAAPALLFVVVFAFRKRRDELQSNVSLMKSRKANRVAKKRLTSAKKLLDANKREEFLDEMFRVLWGFVSDKLQIPVSELTKENVSNALQLRKVSEESIKKFIETLDSCEFARFAPGMAGSNEEIYRKGMDVISGLEEEIV